MILDLNFTKNEIHYFISPPSKVPNICRITRDDSRRL